MEEPRLLIENKKLSYGDKESENMLIHGDNLLALKALETDFSGKIIQGLELMQMEEKLVMKMDMSILFGWI